MNDVDREGTRHPVPCCVPHSARAGECQTRRCSSEMSLVLSVHGQSCTGVPPEMCRHYTEDYCDPLSTGQPGINVARGIISPLLRRETSVWVWTAAESVFYMVLSLERQHPACLGCVHQGVVWELKLNTARSPKSTVPWSGLPSRRDGHIEVNPAKATKPAVGGEADRAGAVQSGEHKAQGDLICVYKHLMGQ